MQKKQIKTTVTQKTAPPAKIVIPPKSTTSTQDEVRIVRSKLKPSKGSHKKTIVSKAVIEAKPKTTQKRNHSKKSQLLNSAVHVFMTIFNAELDKHKAPELHYGRHTWVASRYEVSPSAARKWLTGNGLPEWNNMLLIADDLGLSLDILLGRKPFSKKTIAIPIRTEAATSDSENGLNLNCLQFEDGVLEATMRMKQNGVELYVVSTDSMAPSVNEGDVVFVDTETKQIEPNRLYMFTADGNRILIRRAMVNLDKSVRLTCTNQNYPEITVQLSDISIGRKANGSHLLNLIGEISWMIKKLSGSPTTLNVASL